MLHLLMSQPEYQLDKKNEEKDMKTANNRRFSSTPTRREILRRGMAGISLAGLSGTVLAPSLIGQAAHAAAAAQANEKILVILELSGAMMD